jgi:hypothetical protein
VRPPASRPVAGELSFTVAVAISFGACDRWSLPLLGVRTRRRGIRSPPRKWVGGRREKPVEVAVLSLGPFLFCKISLERLTHICTVKWSFHRRFESKWSFQTPQLENTLLYLSLALLFLFGLTDCPLMELQWIN